ncbi:MAG TPA: YncE family protein [Candidatus Babeliales bacterium]|nr:YncE family protein [Candidatus Babeliales bacterium]
MRAKIQKYFFLSFLFLISPIHAKYISPDRLLATVPVGVTPAGLAITPDNKFAYVADNNNYTFTGQDAVSVINLETFLLQDTIFSATFNQPYTITINAAGTKAYVTNSNSTTVSIIDIASNTDIGMITGFDGPSGFVITPNGRTAYVNNYGGPEGVGSGNGNTVSVVSLDTNTIIQTITLNPVPPAAAPAALAISPDGRFVYTVNYVDGNIGTGTMSIIDTTTNTVIGTIPGFSGPFYIALTANGKFAYVTNFGSNNFFPFGTTVSVVDLTKNSIIVTIKVGIQPSGIAISPNGRYAYVTNYNTLYAGSSFTDLTAGQGTVNIIDIETNTLIPPTLDVGQSPNAIAISSDGRLACVSNYTSNTVTILDILERMWLK